jgi:hypothetical protein
MYVTGCDVPTSSVAVTTACKVRNLFGKYYLRTLIPFHRRGLQKLLAKAVVANRL